MRSVARAGPTPGASPNLRDDRLVLDEPLAVRRLLLAGERDHLVAGHRRGEVELEQAGIVNLGVLVGVGHQPLAQCRAALELVIE